MNDLKTELKKRNLPVSGPKPALIERLKPALDTIIAAGRKQFKQPYRQIAIPHGGLIILKPSPNSQLLVSSDGKEEVDSKFLPSTPQSMHEGTPDIDENSMALSIQPPSPQFSDTTRTTPFSPVNIFSPTGSSHENYQMETNNYQDVRRSVHSTVELESNLNYMDIEQHATIPPPPPQPPAPHRDKKLEPAPVLPASTPIPHQFLPSQQPSQQILQAKAQLEAQLCPAPSSITSQGVGGSRAGPKGQFIWPPVSIQSCQGSVISIRATSHQSASTTTSVMSSKPVAQLAAVFSQQDQLPLNIQLPQEPVPASELGLELPSDLNIEKTSDRNVDHYDSTSDLPETLPKIGDVKEENLILDPNTIIQQQQLQIEELKKALQRSNEQLLTQQSPLITNTNNQHIHNKHLPADLSYSRSEKQEHSDNNFSQSSTMDDVIDILMNNKGKKKCQQILVKS